MCLNNIFKFSTWNQLSGLRSSMYNNLILKVTQYNSEDLIGTKISIQDTDTNSIYFTGFIRLIQSNKFNIDAVYTVDEMINKINSYGFNISIVDKIKLPPNVITILQGLKTMGYNYIILDYSNSVDSNILVEHGYIPQPRAVYSNKWVVATKNLNYVPTTYTVIDAMQFTTRHDMCVVSATPDFSWEDFKWMKPTVAYPISEILENGEVDNGFTI